MKNFDYHRPSSLKEATAPLGAGGRAKSGGTDLVPMLKHGIADESSIVSLTGIRELSGITHDDQSLRIGSGTTIADIADHPELRRRAPAISDAAQNTATPLVRWTQPRHVLATVVL